MEIARLAAHSGDQHSCGHISVICCFTQVGKMFKPLAESSTISDACASVRTIPQQCNAMQVKWFLEGLVLWCNVVRCSAVQCGVVWCGVVAIHVL